MRVMAWPLLIAVLTFGLSFFLLLSFNHDFTELTGVDPDSYFFWVVAVLIGFANIILAGLLSLLAAFIAGALSIENYVRSKCVDAGILKDSIRSGDFWLALLRSIPGDLLLTIGVGIFSALAVLLSFFPPFALLALAASCVCSGFVFCEYPLVLLEEPAGKRFSFFLSNFLVYTALGACFNVLLCIPLAGLILSPVFYQVSIEIIARRYPKQLQTK